MTDFSGSNLHLDLKKTDFTLPCFTASQVNLVRVHTKHTKHVNNNVRIQRTILKKNIRSAIKIYT